MGHPRLRVARDDLRAGRLFSATDADSSDGGFFFATAHRKDLLTREKPDYDGAVPAGNSVILHNLLRLYELSDDPLWREQAERTLALFGQTMARRGSALPKTLSALDFYLEGARQVVIASPPGSDAKPLLDVLRRSFVPNKMVVVLTPEQLSELELPLLRDKKPLAGKPTAFVCRRNICELPTADPELLAKQLAGTGPKGRAN